jgi:uncharacterized membrane protein
MTRYELLFSLHIVAAIIWLGAGFLIAVLVFGAERAGDHAKAAGYHRDVGWLAPRLFIPASLATFVLGLLLVADGEWKLDQLWIVLGLAAWLASFLVGILYFKPEGERIGALVEQQGLASPEANRRLARVTAIERIQLALLFLVVFDMVVKPTGDDGGLLVGAAVILAGVTALALASARRAATG